MIWSYFSDLGLLCFPPKCPAALQYESLVAGFGEKPSYRLAVGYRICMKSTQNRV